MEDRLLTRKEVEGRIRLGRSALYRMLRAGQFPRPVRIGPRAVRWKASEVESWLRDCPRAGGEELEDKALKG